MPQNRSKARKRADKRFKKIMTSMNTYPVKYALMQEFRDLAIREGCKVENVVEQIGRQLIVYWLHVPDGKDPLIEEMAFMTFITNPQFQKYYSITPELLTRIAEDDAQFKFNQEQRNKPSDLPIERIDDQLLVRLILDGIYPLYNKEEKRFTYLKNGHGFYFGTNKREKFDQHWDREIYYLGEGQLNESQAEAIKAIDKFKAIETLPTRKDE